MTFRLLAVVSCLFLCGCGSAYDDCSGTWPFDGQTGVPLTTAVDIWADFDRDPGSNGIAVFDSYRQSTVRYRGEFIDRRAYRIQPDFLPNRDYIITASVGIYEGIDATTFPKVSAQFSTANKPRLLEANLDDGLIELVFSQPVTVGYDWLREFAVLESSNTDRIPYTVRTSPNDSFVMIVEPAINENPTRVRVGGQVLSYGVSVSVASQMLGIVAQDGSLSHVRRALQCAGK